MQKMFGYANAKDENSDILISEYHERNIACYNIPHDTNWIRTSDPAVKGLCLNRLTMVPYGVYATPRKGDRRYLFLLLVDTNFAMRYTEADSYTHDSPKK